MTHQLHERCLRTIYRNKNSTFKESLQKDNCVIMHKQNLNFLTIEMFKVAIDVSLPMETWKMSYSTAMKEVIMIREIFLTLVYQ